MKAKKKGEPESPYSYEEYLVLCKFNVWPGGYVEFENGIIEYVDPQDPQDKPSDGSGSSDEGNGLGSGDGSGSGSGDGSGSGSDDRPHYLVMGGGVHDILFLHKCIVI